MRILSVSFLCLLIGTTGTCARPIRWSSSLEDFDSYMKNTLDAEPDPEFDELIDDDTQNQWELSGKFEGDIILSDKQQKALLSAVVPEGLARNGLRDASRRWPRKTLVYKIVHSHFSPDHVQAIKDGMADLERVSCVRFKEKGRGDSDYVRIQGLRRGCYSKVGYQGNGAQVLNLTPHPAGQGCMRHGTVVHEMLHSLGFFHMQSHTDRDKYVKINWKNIREGREHNFKKYNSLVSTDFGVPYDYDSVMHYSEYAFSKNRRKTIVPLGDGLTSIGQRSGLSDKDIAKLNRMYGCDGGGGGGESEEVEDGNEEESEESYSEKPRKVHKYEVVENVKEDGPEDFTINEEDFAKSSFFDFGSWL